MFANRVLAHAAAGAERRAMVGDGVSLTYGGLVERARRGAARLASLGFRSGGSETVGIVASNGIDFGIVVVACHLAGVTVVPLPTSVPADALARMIADAGVTLLFHDRDHSERVSDAVGLTKTPERIRLVPFAADGLLDAWLGDDLGLVEPTPRDPSDSADIIYSSGTTGVPKGIVQSHQARAAACANLGAVGFSTDSHLLQTVSLYSNFGLASFYLTLWWGGTFLAMRKFSGPAVVELMNREPIDHAWFAPATLVRTMEAPGFAEAAGRRTCSKLCAGAPLSAAHKAHIVATWPGALYDLYGQTETGTLSVLAVHAVPASKLGSVGPILPTAVVRILDDAGQPLPADQEGEIAGHTPTLMSGYHGLGEGATATWIDPDGRRFIRTGDIGKIDADGFLWLCDRKKDLIISGGFNVYPADIERILQGHPAVLEVAVVGFPSARWGESPVAFVTPRTGVGAESEAVRSWVNERVANYQRVARVVILASLPSGTMGKISKRELRNRHADEIGTLP